LTIVRQLAALDGRQLLEPQRHHAAAHLRRGAELQVLRRAREAGVQRAIVTDEPKQWWR
jgi:hypothetical protein